jgi:hypothetical protein
VVASARAPAPIVCVAVLREVVVGGSADGTLRFWRATTGRCGNDSVRHGNGACHAVCLSVCRVRLLSALSSFDLRAAPLKLCARELPGATGAAGMPHSPYVLCGCAQGDVFVFDAESQQVCCVGAHLAHSFTGDLAPTSRIYPCHAFGAPLAHLCRD